MRNVSNPTSALPAAWWSSGDSPAKTTYDGPEQKQSPMLG